MASTIPPKKRHCAATAMARVWAMLKLDFDPEGTPATEDSSKHAQEQRPLAWTIKLTTKICREIIRKEFGDAGVAIYDSAMIAPPSL